MKTKIIKINPDSIDSACIKVAADVIKKGGLVAFPTETVYGLGADVFNTEAVSNIFRVKQRPLEDPLIVHICRKEDFEELAKDIPDVAFKLVNEFWPGPLTLVLKKAKCIPDVVTGGLDTVAIRMPEHKVALEFIKLSETPIAAPSANLFGTPSSTTAQHVLDDLNGKIDIIIDAGRTKIGVESTILDLTHPSPVILRHGGISFENLKRIAGEIQIYKREKILSPGMYPRHYSPRAKVILIEGKDNNQVSEVKKMASTLKSQGYHLGILTKEENIGHYKDYIVKTLGSEKSLEVCASNLFSVLREFDREGINVIIVEGFREEGIGRTIMDRLRKAASN